MLNKYIELNNESRARLSKLVHEISGEELKLMIYQEGWTIAAMLAHIAFWDERRAINLEDWKKNGIAPSGITEEDTRIINDTLVPFTLALAPRKAAGLVIKCAEHVDKVIEELSPELANKIEALGDKYALNRGLHRKMHLDEIDVFLKAKRGK